MTIMICEHCGCGAFLLYIDKAGSLYMKCSSCGAGNVLMSNYITAAGRNRSITGRHDRLEAGT